MDIERGSKHYKYQNNDGNVMKQSTMSDHTPIGDGNRAIRLEALYKKIGEPDANGCMPWLGMTNNIGYPFIPYLNFKQNKYRMMLATRALLMLKLGRDILPKHNANHTCHNRWCMNEQHLEEGTQTDKMRKMREDKRLEGRTNPHGVGGHRQHGRKYKYTDEEIQFQRTATFEEIAARFNVPRDKAYNMKRGAHHFYKWLPFPDDK